MFDSISYSLRYMGLSQLSSSVIQLASGQPRVFLVYLVLVSHYDRAARFTYDKIEQPSSASLLALFLIGGIDFWFPYPLQLLLMGPTDFLALHPLLSQERLCSAIRH